MNCQECIKINPLPRCIDPGDDMLLENVVFENNPDDEIRAILEDIATGRKDSFLITTDANGEVVETYGEASDGINLKEYYNLMDHPYKLSFLDTETSQPIEATVDESKGCCIEFNTIQIADNDLNQVTASADECP